MSETGVLALSIFALIGILATAVIGIALWLTLSDWFEARMERHIAADRDWSVGHDAKGRP